MTRFIHLYPFAPWGMFGGSMRVRFAAESSETLGETAVYWWDAEAGAWSGPLRAEDVGRPGPMAEGALASGAVTRLKRAVFPSALWETSRHALAAAPPRSAEGDVFVLHCSLLAPLATQLRASGARVVVDVHDLVYRTHEHDAGRAQGPLRWVRRGYAHSVRRRELEALRAADAVLFAGWTDTQDFNAFASVDQTIAWAPTGLTVPALEPRRAEGLRVGILGNFAHTATSQPADALLGSPLASSPQSQIVLAGLGSTAWAEARGVDAMGPVESVVEFYAQVDAVVVPVDNASGMKTKLAEAAMMGVPVVTTSAGAAGFSEELTPYFDVLSSLSELTVERVARFVGSVDRQAMQTAFEARLSAEAASRVYRSTLEPKR